MKESGAMIWPMVLVIIFMLMEAGTKEIGRMTNSMDSERNNGLMDLALKVTIIWARSKEKELLNGQMEVYTLANSRIIIFIFYHQLTN